MQRLCAPQNLVQLGLPTCGDSSEIAPRSYLRLTQNEVCPEANEEGNGHPATLEFSSPPLPPGRASCEARRIGGALSKEGPRARGVAPIKAKRGNMPQVHAQFDTPMLPTVALIVAVDESTQYVLAHTHTHCKARKQGRAISVLALRQTNRRPTRYASQAHRQ